MQSFADLVDIGLTAVGLAHKGNLNIIDQHIRRAGNDTKEPVLPRKKAAAFDLEEGKQDKKRANDVGDEIGAAKGTLRRGPAHKGKHKNHCDGDGCRCHVVQQRHPFGAG